jgi:hypothetical protein
VQIPLGRYNSVQGSGIVSIHVPLRVVKRGGRKEMQLPERAIQPQRIDNTLVKTLARAFRTLPPFGPTGPFDQQRFQCSSKTCRRVPDPTSIYVPQKSYYLQYLKT